MQTKGLLIVNRLEDGIQSRPWQNLHVRARFLDGDTAYTAIMIMMPLTQGKWSSARTDVARSQ
jgi:hypothetical protein